VKGADMPTPEQKLGRRGSLKEAGKDATVTRLLGAAKRRLHVFSTADAGSQPQRDYLLKHVILPGDWSVWYGPPHCGKTFLMMHLAYGIAQGRRMFQRRVRQAPTLYVALEGQGGMHNRVRAMRSRHGDAGGFHYIAEPLALLESTGKTGPARFNAIDVEALTDAITECGARLVVIDTLSHLLGGSEENDSTTMSAIVAVVQQIVRATGAHVALVHHSPKAGTDGGPRGHSALGGAADVLIAINGNNETISRTAQSHKVKDGPPLSVSFTLDEVDLGRDSDGDAIISMAVVEADNPPKRPPKKMAPKSALLYGDISNIMADPSAPWAEIRLPDGKLGRGLTRTHVRDQLKKMGRFSLDTRGQLTGNDRGWLRDTLHAASASGLIGFSDEHVWPLGVRA
jgi:hypothetical protein